ncbi:hypothetical protein LJC11_03630, partial [Bacteroidales bacterium OttesenSCG-928-I21]|nr:hypothetical protein [Bacteroidales bacterium OttesenSCG-928-I21]
SQRFMKSYFKDQFGNSKMFGFSENGTLYINDRQFNRAMRNGNENQRALLSGMKEAINDNETVNVHINEKSDKFKLSNETWERDITTDRSGAIFPPDRKFSDYNLIINDTRASSETYESTISIMTPKAKTFLNTNLKTGQSASSVFMHETLDEFLNYFIKGGTNNPVDYQNKALENKGQAPRTATDHQ